MKIRTMTQEFSYLLSCYQVILYTILWALLTKMHYRTLVWSLIYLIKSKLKRQKFKSKRRTLTNFLSFFHHFCGSLEIFHLNSMIHMVTQSTVKIIWTLHFQNKRAQVIRPKVRTGSVEWFAHSLKTETVSQW